MIEVPRGWKRARTRDGIALWDASTTLRYVERLRPLRRIADLVAQHGRPPGFELRVERPLERFTTSEGEFACLVVHEGELAGQPAEVLYGFVILDDYYAEVVGVSRGESRVRLVRSLLEGDQHLLGRDRRRRFVYTPPAGWHGVGNTFEARWYPLDYPRNPSRIWVNPALPWTDDLENQIMSKLGGGAPLRITASTPLATRSLVGVHHRTAIRERPCHLLFLRDERYLYSVRADGDDREALALISTIEPLALPAQTASRGASLAWLAE